MANKQSKFNIKKTIGGVLLLIIFAITITGCGSQPKTVVELNKDNFEEYFVITKNIEGFSVDERNNSFIGGKLYTGYATLKITIKPKKDIIVDSVAINGKVMLNGLCWARNIVKFSIQLDKDGYGEYSESIKTNQGILRPENPSILEFELTEITGTIKK